MTERVLQIAEELYSLPLGDFTRRRDALVKELKGEDKSLSEQVKGLRKPTVSAWVVDLLVRRETAQVEQLLQVGVALRDAQENLDGEELRALTKQRRQLTGAVTGVARKHARKAGLAVTSAVAEQVEQTLTAAMLDADAAAAVRSGLLVSALTPTTVDQARDAVALPAALGFEPTAQDDEPADEAERPGLRAVPDPDADEKAREAARAELERAEQARTAAVDALEQASSEVSDLEARSLQLQAEIDELRRKVGDLETESEQVDDELSDAEDTRDEARSEAERAEKARDDAAAALKRLKG